MIGIDPGQKGAVAVIRNGYLADVWDMPVQDGAVDGVAIYEVIYRQTFVFGLHHATPVVWIELVHSYPKQGVASTFKFGKSYGIAIGAAQASGASINYTRPEQWKEHFGLIGSSKRASLELARELFPEHLDRFKLMKHEGRAEAALIALYGLEHTP